MSKTDWKNIVIAIPKQGTPASQMLAPGSALARSRCLGDQALYYYEGNLYQASNLRQFSEKAYHAASRAVENYPTIAKSLFAQKDVWLIGSFDERHIPLYDIPPEALTDLSAWLGAEAQQLSAQRQTLIEQSDSRELAQLIRTNPAKAVQLINKGMKYR